MFMFLHKLQTKLSNEESELSHMACSDEFFLCEKNKPYKEENATSPINPFTDQDLSKCTRFENLLSQCIWPKNTVHLF